MNKLKISACLLTKPRQWRPERFIEAILIWIACCLLFITTAVEGKEVDLLSALEHKDWQVRRNAAQMLGAWNDKSAVRALIDTLTDDNPEVRQAAHQSLIKITEEKDLPLDYTVWSKWWMEKGHTKFEELTPNQQELAEARTYLNVGFIVIVISLILLLLFIMVFSFIGGSKIKEIKEIIKKAERYTTDAEEVTRKFDRIMEELEKRRTEIADSINKLREENTTELERFLDLLQQNTEHQLRESMMGLREKAETELRQTLTQLRQDVQQEIKMLSAAQRENLTKEFKEREEQFLNEVTAQTLFLEASFQLHNANHQEALRLYKKVLDIKPDHTNAWNNTGTALRRLNRYEEALEAATKAYQLSPDNALVSYNLAATYALLHRKPEMLNYLARSFQNNPELKDESLNDNVFKEYWHDKAFKDIAEA